MMRAGKPLRYVVFSCLLCVIGGVAAEGDLERYDISIQVVDAEQVLKELAAQTESLLLFPFELAENRRVQPISGRYTIEQALGLLLADSGLVGVLSNHRVISVTRVNKPENGDENMQTTTKKTLLGRFMTGLAAVLVASPAISAAETTDEDEPYIEEIIVTAEKREENVLDVPVTMSAFSSQMIEELGMTNHDDLEQLVPGLQFQDEGQQTGQGTTIRGIGTRLAWETHPDLAVATYVDGVYTLGIYGVAPNMFDLERVEVARGPQGTLHGRNSIAGSISYFSKRPTDHWDLLVHTEFTDQFTQRYGVAYGGPISENFSFRLNGSYYEGDGAQENLGFGDDYDAPDQKFIAPQLRFKTDRMDLNLRYTKLNDDGVPRTQVLLTNFDTSSPTDFLGSPNAFYMLDDPVPSIDANCPPRTPGWECGDLENIVNVNRSAVGGSRTEQSTVAFSFDLNDQYTLRYNFGDTDTFSAVQRDRDHTNRVGRADDRFTASDADVPLVDAEVNALYEYTEKSHELQLVSNLDGKFNFIVGAFTYENFQEGSVLVFTYTNPWIDVFAEDAAIAAGYPGGCEDIRQTILIPFGFSTTPEEAIANGEPGNYWQCPEGNDHTQRLLFRTNASSETEAIFFNGEYRVNEQWLISGGLRYTEDTKNQGQNGGWAKFGFSFIGSVPIEIIFDDSDPNERIWDKTIGHVSLEYTPDQDRLIYGRVSTGYRAGGFNSKSDAFPAFIKEESLVNYELGMKGLFMDRRLRLTSGVFYNDFDDYQITGQIQQQGLATGDSFSEFATSPIAEFTDNIPDSKLWGAEVDFMYHVNENWRISGFYAYLDSEIGPHLQVVIAHPNPQTGLWTHRDFTSGEIVTSEYILPSDMTGNQLPLQPNHKFALTASYETPLTGAIGGHLQLLGTYSWVGKRASDLSNFDISTMPAYDRFDLRGTWTSPSEAISASLFVQNVFDEIGVIEFLHQSTTGGAPASGTLTDPRSIGLEVRWRPQL